MLRGTAPFRNPKSRTHPIALGCVCILLALAGCVASPASSAPVAPETGSTQAWQDLTFTWGLTDCDAVVALVPVDASRIAPHIPAGFSTATPSEAGLPPFADAMGDAVFAVESFTCERVSGGGASTEAAGYGSIFTVVHPPPDLEDPDVDFLYVYKWDTLIVDDGFRATLSALGIPAVAGTATVSRPPALHAGPVEASLTLDTSTYKVTVSGLTPPGPFGGTFIDFGPSDHGIAVWKATGPTEAFSQGAARIVIPRDSLGQEIVGAGEADGFAALGKVPAFENGTLRFARAPGGR